jgi:hypothetical protein
MYRALSDRTSKATPPRKIWNLGISIVGTQKLTMKSVGEILASLAIHFRDTGEGARRLVRINSRLSY